MKKPVKRAPPGPRSRGRPRSEAARQAILQAARELLADGGPGAVTMEAVAARAGVGKPTVYRWWPDRHAVAIRPPAIDGRLAHAGPGAVTMEAVAARARAPVGE